MEDACLGFQHALVRTRAGRAFAWGKGERGQLGNGATANHPSAFPLDLPEGTPPVVKVRGSVGVGGWRDVDSLYRINCFIPSYIYTFIRWPQASTTVPR